MIMFAWQDGSFTCSLLYYLPNSVYGIDNSVVGVGLVFCELLFARREMISRRCSPFLLFSLLLYVTARDGGFITNDK
jgi:hypothetical protein